MALPVLLISKSKRDNAMIAETVTTSSYVFFHNDGPTMHITAGPTCVTGHSQCSVLVLEHVQVNSNIRFERSHQLLVER